MPRQACPQAFVVLCVVACLCALCSISRVGPGTQTKKRSSAAKIWMSFKRWVSPTVRAKASSSKLANDTMLCREQTEEWKGWMQLVFLWYHYFHVHEIYTFVRVCIASYVWLTGFGNFRYLYTTQDLTWRRLARVLWRINFFPVCLGLVFHNPWMFYYICALHSVFTVLTFLILKIHSTGNAHPRVVACKIGIACCASLYVWNVLPRASFDALWGPLQPLFHFQHVAGPHQDDRMYEWYFRSKLDHLIWLAGIAVAFGLPKIHKGIDWLARRRSRSIPCVAVILAVFAGYWWTLLRLDKRSYNAVHPYVSAIPVLGYVLLRNLFPCARQRYAVALQSIGKITLECYAAQMHIWMGTSGPNGSAAYTLHLLPGRIPASLSFVLFSMLHLCTSYRIFQLTEALKDALIPVE